MMVAGSGMRVVVATRPVDFRKGHDALAASVEHELGLDPYSGVVVVFRSRRADRVKVLWWDGTGPVLASKRLERGQFAWPSVRDGVMRVSRAQFEGLDWRRVWVPRVRRPRAAAGVPGRLGSVTCGPATSVHWPFPPAAGTIHERGRPCGRTSGPGSRRESMKPLDSIWGTIIAGVVIALILAAIFPIG